MCLIFPRGGDGELALFMINAPVNYTGDWVALLTAAVCLG